MKNARRLPFLREFTVQLFFLTVLSLTLLLLVIALGSVSLHQKDMQARGTGLSVRLPYPTAKSQKKRER